MQINLVKCLGAKAMASAEAGAEASAERYAWLKQGLGQMFLSKSTLSLRLESGRHCD